MKTPSCSLIISTYNWPQALALVLDSVLQQSHHADEILIADDGSDAATAELIRRYQKRLPIRHIWHKDQGFRKAAILNQAIAVAQGEYLIQVDGDCILHRHFIRDHLALAEPNVYLYGSRVNIKQNHLPSLFARRQTRFGFFAKGIGKRTRNIHAPVLSRQYRKTAVLPHKFRGCNASFWRQDVIAVNGYNQDFNGWGREDSELIIRLINHGVLGKRIRYRGIVYHIYHPEQPRNNLNINDQIQQQTIDQALSRCHNGIDQYLVK